MSPRTVRDGTGLPAFFRAVLIACLALVPVPAPAASGVGLIMPLACDLGPSTQQSFSQQLQQAGIPPGAVELIVQKPGVDRASVSNSIRKLVAYEAKLLVVFGGTAAREAASEARDIPVVFMGAYDPVGEGIIPAPDKPGKNITGVYSKTPLATLLDAVQESIPDLKVLGAVWHSDNQDASSQIGELKTLAAKRGIQLITADLKGSPFEAAARTLQPASIVYLAAGVWPEFAAAADLEKLNRPLVTQCYNAADARPVFSLAGDSEEMMAEAARMASRILKGEKPSQIPVVSIKKIAFTVDLQAAQKHGIKVPFTVLGRATRVLK